MQRPRSSILGPLPQLTIKRISIMPTPCYSSLYSFYQPARRRPQRYTHQQDELSESPAIRRSGRIAVPIPPSSELFGAGAPASRESPRNQLSSHKNVRMSRASDRNKLIPAGVIVKSTDGEAFAADFGMDGFFTLFNDNHCVVCLDEWQPGQTVLRSQNCSHVFHSSCIMSWMNRSNECPSCRECFLRNDRPSVVTSLSEVVNGGDDHEGDAELEEETGLDENTSSDGHNIDPALIALQQQRELLASRLDFGTVREADSMLLVVTFKSPALWVSLQATPCLLCSKKWIPEAVLAQSSNPMCPHYYHGECILQHLMHTSSDCPRCRRTFVDDGAYCRPTTRSASERSSSSRYH